MGDLFFILIQITLEFSYYLMFNNYFYLRTHNFTWCLYISLFIFAAIFIENKGDRFE